MNKRAFPSWSWIVWTLLIITLTYLPFLGFRVIRMAGDEKVYVSQALEMAARGNWFLQVLQGQPDYYKGPLHYLLLRLGLLAFGKSAWAALYMNYLLLIGGGLSLGALIRRLCPKWEGGSVWSGAFFATCIGVYTHSFASQMEAELACLFAIALYALSRTGRDSAGYLFWSIAGLIGWSKSPLHALLAGLAAILFWLLTGELWSRLKNPRAWAAVLLGVSLCAAGYLPAYVLDHQNFISIYIGRETLSKGDSGQHWSVSLYSVLGFYLFPWIILAIISYVDLTWNLFVHRLKNYPPEIRRGLLLAVSWVTPSFIFFWYHPYHFENYNLPVISGVILLVSLVISQTIASPSGRTNSPWTFLYQLACILTAGMLLILPTLLTLIDFRFSPLPSWWPSGLIPMTWITTLASIAGLIYFGAIDRLRRMQALALSMIGFYLSIGATIATLGERELLGLRDYLRTEASAGRPNSRIGYYNLHQNIWSEWGFLNLWTNREYHEIHDPNELKQALLVGESILVPARGTLDDFKAFVKKELPDTALQWTPWKRWRTQGKSETGEPLWREVWTKRDLSLFEIDYFIVKKATASQSKI